MSIEEYYDNKDTNKRFYNLRNIEISPTAVDFTSKEDSNQRAYIGDTITISDLFNLVKTYDKDFKPNPVSVVVNEDGTPKIMYRGDVNDIEVFDRKKSRASNLYGRGFYFTDSKAHASQYGDAKEYYLDIKSPLKPNKNEITKAQVKAFLEAVAENEDDYDIWNYGTSDIDEILDIVYGRGDFEMLQDVSATVIGDLVEAVELFNKVNRTQYDGIILPTETVVFNSNQIKSVDNLGTFDKDNNNVKFKAKSPDELKDDYAQLTAEKAGYTKKVYHGTVDFGFTKIDVSKSDDGISLRKTCVGKSFL